MDAVSGDSMPFGRFFPNDLRDRAMLRAVVCPPELIFKGFTLGLVEIGGLERYSKDSKFHFDDVSIKVPTDVE